MIGGFRQVIQNEGIGALKTGFGPTFAGYFLQGAFKFGGYEFFKKQSIDLLGIEKARQNRSLVYSVSAGCAEFFASVALCPLEATRIRLVSTPGFATGLVSGFGKILKDEGVGAFYSGFGPILFKQYVPSATPHFVSLRWHSMIEANITPGYLTQLLSLLLSRRFPRQSSACSISPSCRMVHKQLSI
jgi:solute carrier family 25 (mitochondrial phosphate transporter), member 3